MAKKKETPDVNQKARKLTLEELKKKGIELENEDQVSGGFPDYPVPPTGDDPDKNDD
uniref:Uncharacterized protein n=1 Tax=Roseihalotalea indica TaxID=2867963 RepID=A0AA49GHP5_9BACT|nr:hypothetical protein K4G66_16685 [Tunicatimonas sp. TK19036]